jgi:NOL1/NOP2/fmu family ribosome biogenesis protein
MMLTAEEGSLPAYEDLYEQANSFLYSRFGIERKVLERLHFIRGKEGEIWVTTAPTPAALESSRPEGIRAFRQTPTGLKPTTVLLCILGGDVKRSRVEVDDEHTLKQLLLGKAIPYDIEDGYIAISHRGDVLGCGEARRGKVRTLISTKKRRELLFCLEQRHRCV